MSHEKFNDGEFYYQSTDGWCTKVHLIGSFTDLGYGTMAVFRYVSPITRRSVVLLASYDSGKVEGEKLNGLSAVNQRFSMKNKQYLNQCDGCRRKLPLENNRIHRGPGKHDVIICTRERYEKPIKELNGQSS